MKKNDLQNMENWLEKLKQTDKLIIVEGKKDMIALQNIGIEKDKIIFLHKPLFQMAEIIAEITKKAIILTDRDIEGKKLYERLRHDLTNLGVRIDKHFREVMLKESDISHIEGIDTYFKHLRGVLQRKKTFFEV